MSLEPTQPAGMPVIVAPVAPDVPRRPPRWLAIPLFCLIAGLIPETIVTSSTSVAKISVEPFSLVFVAIFYGLADMVIREAIVRRRVGLAGKLLLGAAFGFFNEGVVAGTWYTVVPKGYVFLGVWNWGWAVSLTVFHTFMSVLTPIYLFDNIMPSYANTPLLHRRGIIITSALFLGLCLVIALTPHYRAERLLVYAAALLLIALAFALPRPRDAANTTSTGKPTPAISGKPAPSFWRLRLLGFVALLLYFICIYVVPSLLAKALGSSGSISPLPALVSNIALVALAWWGVARFLGWTRRPGWSARRQLAFMSGVLIFGMIISTLSIRVELVANVPFLLLLIILAWREHNAERQTEPLTQPAM